MIAHAFDQGSGNVSICIHSFLVHLHNDETKPDHIGGVEAPMTGRLFDLLSQLDARAEKKCDIDITLRPQDDGTQQDDCLTVPAGSGIAARLQSYTTKRSGFGLLFLVAGKNQHGVRLGR